MMSSPEQGQFLALLIGLLQPQTLLEIGVFTGYTSLWMAKAMPLSARLIVLDMRAEPLELGRPYWQAAGVADRIQVMLGPALESMTSLAPETMDFIYLDADKKNYLAYYERSLELLSPRGLLVVDNTLWYGRLADPDNQEVITKTLREFNQHLYQDLRIQLSLLPLGDGMTLVRRIAEDQEPRV